MIFSVRENRFFPPIFSIYLWIDAITKKSDYMDPPLTSREKEVLKYLVEGKANKTIADSLFISCETVKSHVKNIFRKLNVMNRVEAVRDHL